MLLQVKSNCAILAPLCNVCASIGGSPWAVFTTPAPQYHVMLQRCYNVCPFLVNKSIGQGQSVFVAIAWWFRNHKMSGQMAPGTVFIFFNRDEILWEGTDCCIKHHKYLPSLTLFFLYSIFKSDSCHASNHLVAQTFFAVETPVVLIVHRAGAAARLRPAWCLERGH